MGRTVAPDSLRSAEDVLATLTDFAAGVADGAPYLLVGHSAGAYYAQAIAARHPTQVAGLALVCPLLADTRDVPEHRVVDGSGALGDDEFRCYFVVQTPAMLERYERSVAPAASLVDQAALERIGERWEIEPPRGPAYGGPTLVVAGRRLDRRLRRRPRPGRALPARARSPWSTGRVTPCRTRSRSCCVRC